MKISSLFLTIKARLILLCSVLLLLLVLIGGLGLSGMVNTVSSLNTIYRDRLIPSQQLGNIGKLMRENQILLNKLSGFDPRLSENNSITHQASDYIEAIGENMMVTAEVWDSYMSTYLTPEERLNAEQFAVLRQKYRDEGVKRIIELYRANQYRQGNLHMRNNLDPLFNEANASLLQLIALQDQVALQEYTDSQANYTKVRNWTVAAIIFALLGTILMGRWLIQSIDRPLKRMMGYFSQLANGHLDKEIEVGVKDEIGQAVASLKEMQAQQRQLIIEIQESAENIATGSKQIASGNTDLSQRTEEQAASLQETAASMEQVSSTVKTSAESTAKANQLAYAASEYASNGGDKASQAVQKMQELSVSSEKISGIVSVINSISFQTNILALNASVEAARAGEQGRGFAVVAQEVRKLAQRSSEAAKEIQQLISLNANVVQDGSLLVYEAGKAIDKIVASVSEVSVLMEELKRGSEEQSSAISQVSIAISQMDEVTQHNAALVEQTANASASLEMQAQGLSQAVAFFKVGRPVVNTNSVKLNKLQLASVQSAPNTSATRALRHEESEWEQF